jgi:hypothetical protein
MSLSLESLFLLFCLQKNKLPPSPECATAKDQGIPERKNNGFSIYRNVEGSKGDEQQLSMGSQHPGIRVVWVVLTILNQIAN